MTTQEILIGTPLQRGGPTCRATCSRFSGFGGADPRNLLRLLFALAVLLRAASADAASEAKSPDGKVRIQFHLQSDGAPACGVEYLGRPVLVESRLGFEPAFTNGFRVVATSSSSHHGDWSWAFGERSSIPDNYRQLDVDLKHASGRLLHLTFRAYNEGAAFRYSFPRQTESAFRFTGEKTEFRFPPDTEGYEEHGTEGDYHRVKTSEIQPWCERPLTLAYAGNAFGSLGEAANQHYPRMLLSPLPGVPGALVSALGGTTANTAGPNQRDDPSATLSAGESTPWRYLLLGRNPGEMLERNYLVLNLNPPTALQDLSWIKPGKAMRDTTLTTTNSKAIIDFAPKAGLQYVTLDARWYGSEDAVHGDATTARAPNLDLPEIIRYGRDKNVGLIVYVDRRQLKKQRDTLFPLFEQWGVKGVKIGFVDVGPQAETAWITETIQKAAEHHLLLDIHDGYRATGLGRTWPNLLTVEGIQGNEHMPTPEHNCTLPFTRYTAGPGDYTVCYYTTRKQTTFAHQLAMAVVTFSPLQWIFWYDKPSDWRGEPEIEFFQHVPTVWDETKVLHAEIGQYVILARRHGDEWFVGTLNNRQPRQLPLPLSFLTPGRPYLAHVYSDDPAVPGRTHVAVKTLPVNWRTSLEVTLTAGGGQALWLAPTR